jgi:hypothetical protein
VAQLLSKTLRLPTEFWQFLSLYISTTAAFETRANAPITATESLLNAILGLEGYIVSFCYLASYRVFYKLCLLDLYLVELVGLVRFVFVEVLIGGYVVWEKE